VSRAPAVRGWRPGDAEAAAALSRRYFAPDPAWTAERAAAELTADALGGGDHVRVAERDGRTVGIAAYVAAPPWLYLWPLAADDQAAAAALLDAVLAAGAGPGLTRARVSVRAVEPHKQAAVVARGFTRSIDFLELARAPVPPLDAPALPVEIRRGPRLDRAAVHALHDLTFAEIDNTVPATAADFAAQLDGPGAWPEVTSAWHDRDGRCVGFVIGARAPDHGVVEAIGVDPAWRGRGLGRAMLADLLRIAAATGVEQVRAVVASTNHRSLALHGRAGFVEQARKQLWDLPL